MKAEELWNEFKSKQNIPTNHYEAWCFGGDPDGLLDLVLKKEKTATASAKILYDLEKVLLPQVGEYSVILNSKEEAYCIIQTTIVSVVPFDQVSEEHAFKEGERDKSLSAWQDIHREFFTEELKQVGLTFDEKMLVVCEEFKLVYKR